MEVNHGASGKMLHDNRHHKVQSVETGDSYIDRFGSIDEWNGLYEVCLRSDPVRVNSLPIALATPSNRLLNRFWGRL